MREWTVRGAHYLPCVTRTARTEDAARRVLAASPGYHL
jgi:hypothetical protein